MSTALIERPPQKSPASEAERPPQKTPDFEAERLPQKSFELKSLLTMIAVFAAIIVTIVLFHLLPTEESEYVDTVAGQIQQEMDENKIVLSEKGTRRTVADFKEPILLSHGKASRLIVHTAHLSETVSISSESVFGTWLSSYQDIIYMGDAQYTVDLTQLSEDDFVVNNELKTLTVRIPYAVLSSINIPADQIKFRDIKRGSLLAPKDIEMTSEEHTQLLLMVHDKMKAKLIDDNIIAMANRNAKAVVAELLSATVRSVDPDYTVVIVQ